jgi:hypothetical protein
MVWNDINLTPSLKRYFECCTRDAELIVVRRAKFLTEKRFDQSEGNKNSEKNKEDKLYVEEMMERVPELEEIDEQLHVISINRTHKHQKQIIENEFVSKECFFFHSFIHSFIHSLFIRLFICYIFIYN